MDTLRLGTVSEGTMLDSDLIPIFLDTLELVDAKKAHSLSWKYRKVLNFYAEERVKPYSEAEITRIHEDASWLLNEILFPLLGEYVPDYCYFGAHPGDGSDYGVWISDEAIDNAEYDEELIKIDDLSKLDEVYAAKKELPGQALLRNDHGNMTLYSITGVLDGNVQVKELWSVV